MRVNTLSSWLHDGNTRKLIESTLNDIPSGQSHPELLGSNVGLEKF